MWSARRTEYKSASCGRERERDRERDRERERERDGQRDRESEEKASHTALAFSAHHFISIPIANANH